MGKKRPRIQQQDKEAFEEKEGKRHTEMRKKMERVEEKLKAFRAETSSLRTLRPSLQRHKEAHTPPKPSARRSDQPTKRPLPPPRPRPTASSFNPPPNGAPKGGEFLYPIPGLGLRVRKDAPRIYRKYSRGLSQQKTRSDSCV